MLDSDDVTAGLIAQVSAFLSEHDPATTDRIEFLRARYAAGLAEVHYPTGDGGQGLPREHQKLVNDAFERAGAPDNSPGLNVIGLGMAAPTILAFGTPEQRARFLPSLWTGEDIWCQLFSEPGAGSDLAGLGTRAVRDGDDWIVNGQKVWTSVAHIARWGILLARTDPDLPKHQGLSFFICDMAAPGVEVRPLRQLTGDAEFNEVFFTDVRIPDSQRLGAVGQGWEVSLTTLMNERLSIGSGMSTGFPELFRLCMEMEIDGAAAVDDRAVRAKLAQFAVKQSGLKYTGMRAITALSKGETPGPENSIGKLVAGATMQELAMFALDLQGQAGVVWDETSPQNARFQGMLMRSPATRIEGGSDEILRNIIAERVLGLPADVRVDKNVPFKDIPTSGRSKS